MLDGTKPYVCADAFAHTSGPHDARLVFVGEAWGEQEDLVGRPLIGSAGQEFTRLLQDVGLQRRDVLLTNVFAFRPLNNSIATICGSKKEVGSHYTLAALSQGKYVMPEYLGEVNRLREELLAHPRNLVVALGSTALWALCGRSGIGASRGAVTESTLCPGVKVLPTYHPSYLFKMWENRPIVLADLMKAKLEAGFPEVRRPKRWVLVRPTLREAEEWIAKHLPLARYISVDVETGAGQIKCIGFATSPQHALVIDFVDLRNASGSYWPSADDELRAWGLVERVLRAPQPKLFQNGLYDLQYILPTGIVPRNCTEDLMLLHHSLYPEMKKGLGFLGSIYTNEASWKFMRGKSETEELKRDE